MRNTVILELVNQRLVTPSMVSRYQEVIENFFNEDLTPKKEVSKVVELCQKFSGEQEREYKKTLIASCYPQLSLKDFPNPFTSEKEEKKQKKKLEDFLSQYLEWEEEKEKEARERQKKFREYYETFFERRFVFQQENEEEVKRGMEL